MPPRKKYVQHCPAKRCTGGSAGSIKPVLDHALYNMPSDVVALLKPGHGVFRCTYCGLVWFQSQDTAWGFEPTIVGYYNSRIKRGWETDLAEPRSENTNEYWEQYYDKLNHRRSWRRAVKEV
jgi:hypothetical protein